MSVICHTAPATQIQCHICRGNIATFIDRFMDQHEEGILNAAMQNGQVVKRVTVGTLRELHDCECKQDAHRQPAKAPRQPINHQRTERTLSLKRKAVAD